MILALETATDVCSVALADAQGETVAVAEVMGPRRHAAALAPLIQDVLRQAGCRPDQITAVAVSAGPGSYTGLRIGTSTAKGFCFASGAALVAVPTLDALAEPARALLRAGDLLVAALPSRRDEAYVAAYDAGHPAACWGPAAVAVEELASRLPEVPGRLYVAGPAAERVLPHLRATPTPLPAALVRPRAEHVARLAAARLAEGLVEDAAAFEPTYLTAFEPRIGRPILERAAR